MSPLRQSNLDRIPANRNRRQKQTANHDANQNANPEMVYHADLDTVTQ